MTKEEINKYVNDTCKIGQGNRCCRYLTVGSNGFECAKMSTLKSILDARVEAKTMIAQGDNCDGDFGESKHDLTRCSNCGKTSWNMLVINNVAYCPTCKKNLGL